MNTFHLNFSGFNGYSIELSWFHSSQVWNSLCALATAIKYMFSVSVYRRYIGELYQVFWAPFDNL